MKNVREKIKMMSVNQIGVYHILLEAYNIMRHSSLSKNTRNGQTLVKRNILWEILQTMISKFLRSLSWNVWVLHTVEQSCLTCYHFKWGKPKTQMPSKLCQKIGYGKTFLHINHFLYCCPLISLWNYFG